MSVTRLATTALLPMPFRFRPCIDLHSGAVKQIVGSTLTENKDDEVLTNFESSHGAAHYARYELGSTAHTQDTHTSTTPLHWSSAANNATPGAAFPLTSPVPCHTHICLPPRRLYKTLDLSGGHVIMLGPGNEEQGLAALKEFPQGMQIGGEQPRQGQSTDANR